MLTVTAHPHQQYLKMFNNFLTVVVIIMGTYMIAAPFAPRLLFWWQKGHSPTQGFKYQSHLTATSAPPATKAKALPPPPPSHRLLIPEMQLDAEVFEGTSANTLNKGVWRRPNTSSPDKGGNTVLVAHRFDYNGPAIFYLLDKLKLNDKFALFWDKHEYDYQVTNITTVQPTDIAIEDNTKDPILTLYTCTPMWTAKLRLVVVSKLISDTVIP